MRKQVSSKFLIRNTRDDLKIHMLTMETKLLQKEVDGAI